MQTPTRSRPIGIVLLAASVIVLLCFLATSLKTAFFLLAGALLAGGVFVLARRRGWCGAGWARAGNGSACWRSWQWQA